MLAQPCIALVFQIPNQIFSIIFSHCCVLLGLLDSYNLRLVIAVTIPQLCSFKYSRKQALAIYSRFSGSRQWMLVTLQHCEMCLDENDGIISQRKPAVIWFSEPKQRKFPSNKKIFVQNGGKLAEKVKVSCCLSNSVASKIFLAPPELLMQGAAIKTTTLLTLSSCTAVTNLDKFVQTTQLVTSLMSPSADCFIRSSSQSLNFLQFPLISTTTEGYFSTLGKEVFCVDKWCHFLVHQTLSTHESSHLFHNLLESLLLVKGLLAGDNGPREDVQFAVCCAEWKWNRAEPLTRVITFKNWPRKPSFTVDLLSTLLKDL